MKTSQGLIVDLKGGLYKVKEHKTNFIYKVKGRGKLRYNNLSPVVGDNVIFSIEDNVALSGSIEEILERKNKLERPNVANIDKAIIVSSVTEPYLNDYIIDKMLFIIEFNNIEPILVFTKIDLLNKLKENKRAEVKAKINDYKKIGYEIIESSWKNFEKDKILKILEQNKVYVITGQTGVGKSTFLNNLNNNLNLKTDEISKALGRGKHTTRHVELLEVVPYVYIVDTPGFSSFDISNINSNQKSYIMTPFKKYLNKCKFNNCMHINEPGCEVKKDLEKNNFSLRLYKNYLKILNEFD